MDADSSEAWRVLKIDAEYTETYEQAEDTLGELLILSRTSKVKKQSVLSQESPLECSVPAHYFNIL
jgi:hypothetical protein